MSLIFKEHTAIISEFNKFYDVNYADADKIKYLVSEMLMQAFTIGICTAEMPKNINAMRNETKLVKELVLYKGLYNSKNKAYKEIKKKIKQIVK